MYVTVIRPISFTKVNEIGKFLEEDNGSSLHAKNIAIARSLIISSYAINVSKFSKCTISWQQIIHRLARSIRTSESSVESDKVRRRR